ncbi:MAG: GNAT family N-acetyltransferase [Deltaproteobacteria bacterium]|nr:MAG: GNAT family N-acetyltransferase [Deltaproteobacteria bacterium]
MPSTSPAASPRRPASPSSPCFPESPMGTLTTRTARLVHRLKPAGPPRIEAATTPDLPAIDALLAPHIASGRVLPRKASADAFLVARQAPGHGGSIVGAVALTAWSDRVVELGSLAVDAPGLGLGTRLVRAAEERAAALGFDRVVALTSSPGFFLRCGWQPSAHSPWARARALDADPAPPMLSAALDRKAQACAACPRLATCTQTMLVTSVARAEAA